MSRKKPGKKKQKKFILSFELVYPEKPASLQSLVQGREVQEWDWEIDLRCQEEKHEHGATS